ncbi:UNVERIFIED_ASMBLY: hypothetical protein SD1_04 [Shigella phage 2019SD1]|uniref:Uncharacterized protein n=1 Tax=Shigella phage 2019SD1 TaxID=2848074 RepID=A0A6M5CAM1_9CAUD|nr:hypothetical protein H1N84_gp04 [Shigella phage 2019SD1]
MRYGQVSDTSAYNIDGACVLENAAGNQNKNIFVGVAVQHGGVDEGKTKILAKDASAPAFGATIKLSDDGQVDTASGTIETNWIATGDFTEFQDLKLVEVQVQKFRQFQQVNKYGAHLAKDASAPAFGATIKLSDDGQVDTASGTIETNWIATGDFTEFQDLKLVEVQVQKFRQFQQVNKYGAH